MTRRTLARFLLVLALCAGGVLGGDRPLYGQGKRTGAAGDGQREFDELVRSAERTERIGYAAAGVGLLLVVAAIPVGVYLGRRKKARKRPAADAGE